MQTFCSSYIFPPIDKYAGSPSRDPFYGIAHLNPTDVAQPLCQPRNWNPGWVFLSNFKTKHSRPREKGLERSVQTDTGGCKKRHLRRSNRLRVYYCLKFYSVQKCRFRYPPPRNVFSSRET